MEDALCMRDHKVGLNPLQKGVLMLIASKLLPVTTLFELSTSFSLLDEEGHGYICLDHLLTILKNLKE